MKVLAVILPVLTMIILGFACRKTGVISKDCVNGLKFLASKVMLPVSVFHALATASLDGGTVIPEIIILAMLVLTFGAGFFMRRFMKEPYKRYIPFRYVYMREVCLPTLCTQAFAEWKIWHILRFWTLPVSCLASAAGDTYLAIKDMVTSGLSALILYMSAPGSFVIPSFVKNEKGSVFVSTTNSLYCILSLAVYAVVVIVVR